MTKRRPMTTDHAEAASNLTPDRVTRLFAGNREPGVEARLLFPGWGPKLWEKVSTPESERREQRYGGG